MNFLLKRRSNKKNKQRGAFVLLPSHLSSFHPDSATFSKPFNCEDINALTTDVMMKNEKVVNNKQLQPPGLRSDKSVSTKLTRTLSCIEPWTNDTSKIPQPFFFILLKVPFRALNRLLYHFFLENVFHQQNDDINQDKNDNALLYDSSGVLKQNYSSILHDKIEQCCTLFTFGESSSEDEAKQNKKQALMDLIEYVNSGKWIFSKSNIEDFFQMISVNIFRPLTPPSNCGNYLLNPLDAEEDEPKWESCWPHLQLVYELLLRFVVCNVLPPKILKEYIDSKFIVKLLELFSSEDPRERDYLKTILHRIYGEIMSLRSFIRQSIHHRFLVFLEQGETFSGITELLEILASIINGFAQPLKEEHKIFLQKALLPLHKSRTLASFNQQLTYCILQYLEKDDTLVVIIITELLKYWPITNTSKEVLFLSEIEEILEYTQPQDFTKIMIPLFSQLTICMESPHFQVAERVLFMWNSECILELINLYREQLFPILISPLYRNSKNHWNSTVHSLTCNVMKILSGLSPELFQQCTTHSQQNEIIQEENQRHRDLFWNKLKKAYDESH
ncbi:serine/threonine-protein phosphatase 2A 56 kDa regulatory subunit epsilon isoform-like isoform X2 [Hylaeus volcanicus]|uniref:serine/threonine-protein phosphatase 2A 56 kDa regulatory subunit epsilon isoform-like isoform X2 n=1 Tax=Hylaeus volcanicus TaxID=313075 RepID=UPI0023B843FB|nr:serine/threonine-protein phosphatase 2A 56 kDa regulatory subunit epsilon isoform-like isoform X2 [Hylaeus volcanicus]